MNNKGTSSMPYKVCINFILSFNKYEPKNRKISHNGFNEGIKTYLLKKNLYT